MHFIVQAHIRRKMSKEERLAMVKAGREDRGAYVARAAVKQKKVRFRLLRVCFWLQQILLTIRSLICSSMPLSDCIACCLADRWPEQ